MTLFAVIAANLVPLPARLLGCAVVMRALSSTKIRPSSQENRAASLRILKRTVCILVAVSAVVALQPLTDVSLFAGASFPLRVKSDLSSSVSSSRTREGFGTQAFAHLTAKPTQDTSKMSWWDYYIMRWFRLEPLGEGKDQQMQGDGQGFRDDLARLGRLARNEAGTLCLGVTFLLIAAGLRTVIPQAVAQTLIAALKPGTAAAGSQTALLQAAKRLGMLAFGFGVFSGLRGLVMSVAENRLLTHLRRQTLTRLLQQDIAFHDVRDVGELTSRLNSDCEAVASGLSVNFNIFLRSGVQLVFGVIYLAFTSWQLSCILLAVWAVLFFVYSKYGTFARKSSLLRQDKVAKLNSVATEALQNVRTVRALSAEGAMSDKYETVAQDLIFLEHQRAVAYGIYATFYNGLTEGIKAVALATGGVLVARGVINPEQLTASMLYVDNVVSSSLAVGGQYRQLMQAIGSSRKVFEYAEMPPSASVLADDQFQGQHVPVEKLRGLIEFRNVSFTYVTRPEERVLKGINLQLPPGKTTALVGASGSGKSTIASLVQRWYEPDDGDILLDGYPIKQLDPRWFRSLFGVVSQDPHLFTATVFENIALGLVGTQHGDLTGDNVIGDAETAQMVRQAAKAADAHDFIERLPNGYDTMIGDVRLSGGQRQRLALARALVREPRILILDEATSALDRNTESSVQVAVNEYLRRRSASCLVIAHRLSTVIDADQIVVVESGLVAEVGTHKELLKRPGSRYAQLVQGGVL